MNDAVRRLLRRFPRLDAVLRRLRDRLLPSASVSTHYVEVSAADADSEGSRLRSAWQADELPQRQRELVDRQLAEYRGGLPIDVFDVMVQALRALCEPGRRSTVLEVGCSSGYYSEVCEIARLPVEYTGCDYSQAFIDLARECYPDGDFDVEDATALRYPDASFDIVISGCCLLHIPEYEQAVAETARVTRGYAIFHRTPVVLAGGNRHYRKKAYGVETVEIHFDEGDLLALFRCYGLEPVDTFTLSEERDPRRSEQGRANRTYVCRKVTA